MKNKKKLLIAVAAMGLVAVATAGVGTMAWWNATTGSVTVSTGDAIGTISTANSTLSGIEIEADWSASDLEDISLSRNSSSAGTSGTLTTYVRNAAGNMVAATATKYYGSAVVTLNKKSLTAEQLKVFTGNWHAVVEVTNPTDANGHTVTLGTAASSTTTFTDAVSNKVSVPFKIDTSGAFTTSAVTVYVRIDGGAGTVGSAIDSHDFAATISATISVNTTAIRDGDYSA